MAGWRQDGGAKSEGAHHRRSKRERRFYEARAVRGGKYSVGWVESPRRTEPPGGPRRLDPPTLALSRDGLFLAVGCNTGDAYVIHVPDCRLVSSPMHHPRGLGAIAIHP